MSTCKDLKNEAAILLWDAADYIDEHGWCQGHLRTMDGRVCAMGALHGVFGSPHEMCNNAFTIRPLLVRVVKALVNHIQKLHPCNHIPSWNDNICQTKEEVTQAFREAAVLVEKGKL